MSGAAGVQKIVINQCFGGFGLSDAAYERLIAWGVPVRAYVQQERGENGLYSKEPANEGEIIFDRSLTPRGTEKMNDLMYWKAVDSGKPSGLFGSRYWDSWIDGQRTHPMVVRVVEELGEAANGACAKLAVVEIPAGVEYQIEEYDGREHVAEAHRTWP